MVESGERTAWHRCRFLEYRQKFAHLMQRSYDHVQQHFEEQAIREDRRPGERRAGGGGVGTRSTRRISCTRTVSWAIMGAPPRVASLDTRHPRGLCASSEAPTQAALFMTRPHLTYASPHPQRICQPGYPALPLPLPRWTKPCADARLRYIYAMAESRRNVKVRRLHEQGEEADFEKTTPSERISMM